MFTMSVDQRSGSSGKCDISGGSSFVGGGRGIRAEGNKISVPLVGWLVDAIDKYAAEVDCNKFGGTKGSAFAF